MSILISGMEMPTAEQGVRTINIYADGVVTNYAEVTIGKAVPVPPHGRLIDADEFFKALTMDDCVSILEAMHVQSILSDAPTIIPADPPGMFYPQIPGITPTVISDKEGER